MRPIPQNHRKQFDTDPYFKKCARADEGECEGRITIEHAWIYASKQINEMWAYLPLCEWHHLYGGLNKHLNQYLTLMRATPEDLAKYPKKNWAQELETLKNILNK